MSTPQANQITVVTHTRINGKGYDVGTVLGVLTAPLNEGERPQCKIKEVGVTVGHLEARLNTRVCQCLTPDKAEALANGVNAKTSDGKQADAPGDDLKPPYGGKGVTQPKLLAEVNRRRKAGRQVDVASTKKSDIIKALKADDALFEEQRDAQTDDDNETDTDES